MAKARPFPAIGLQLALPWTGPAIRSALADRNLVKLATLWGFLKRRRWAVVSLVSVAAFVGFVAWTRRIPYTADPLLQGSLEIVGSLLAFTYAANALVRFRGTNDRISLILALGFVLSGLIEMVSSLALYRGLSIDPEAPQYIPLAWMVGRTLLAALLVAALAVERRAVSARESGKEIAGAVLVVAAVAYLTSALYLGAPARPAVHPGSWLPRAWDLLPATIFLVAALGFRQRLQDARSAFDRAIFSAALLNFLCHLAASQSDRMLDVPSTLAHVLKLTSYAIVLGGALLDNARLFDQVRQLAVSDPLTGLANYSRFSEALEAEVLRSQRTGRPFAVLLLDLDGLKKINDRFGHLTGNRAIRRLGEVLRHECRAIDIPARYGGDEFAVILPETAAEEARNAAARIRERLARDAEKPPISASIGVAVYPQDGELPERLLAAADRGLYKMKARMGRKVSLRHMTV